jgi:hypothetical protein
MTIRFEKAKIYQNHHNWSLLCIKSQPNCKQILNKILFFKKIKTCDLNQTTLLNLRRTVFPVTIKINATPEIDDLVLSR